jgi:hypothetical protein
VKAESIRECVMTWIEYKEGDELMMDTRLLTPKIGTGKRLPCEPNLAEEHHSAEGFPQSIR